MNENIKKMILKLAEKAVYSKRFKLSIYGTSVTVMVIPKDHDAHTEWEWEYYDCIYLMDSDVEERLKKALDYVNSLGGNENG